MTINKFLKLIFFVGIIFCVTAGGNALVEKVKNASVFKVTSVEIKGVMNADRGALIKLSNSLMGLNIFNKDIEPLLVSDDPWIQKLTAHRILPNSINLVVFEEKPLFNYRVDNKCYIYTGTNKHLLSECNGVKISLQGSLNDAKAKQFADMLELYPMLSGAKIVLKDYNFTAIIDEKTIICPYDAELFAKNYDVYVSSLRDKYKRIDYVDLTVKERIFVKGDKNGSSKG